MITLLGKMEVYSVTAVGSGQAPAKITEIQSLVKISF